MNRRLVFELDGTEGEVYGYFQDTGEPVRAHVRYVPNGDDDEQATPRLAIVAMNMAREGFATYRRELMRERSEELASSHGDGLKVVSGRGTDTRA